MRWWSDCTANWREKWSKVRTERNRSREEAKVLRTKLEMALKDSSAVRREKQSIEHENEFLRSELERMAQQQQEEDSQSERKSCHSFIPHHHQQENSRFVSVSCVLHSRLKIHWFSRTDWERRNCRGKLLVLPSITAILYRFCSVLETVRLPPVLWAMVSMPRSFLLTSAALCQSRCAMPSIRSRRTTLNTCSRN